MKSFEHWFGQEFDNLPEPQEPERRLYKAYKKS